MPRLLQRLWLLTVLATAWAADVKDEAWIGSRRGYWAFQKPVRPDPPALTDPWIRTPIDAFVLEAMRAKGLTPSKPIDRERLLRRVTLDVTGLPPTPGEIDNFLADKSPDAYEKLVSRLLESPAYGERWATRWLDVVRYADTNGYELDAERPQAWRYRDYVVRAFQNDKPYDRFLREQIAGDELWPGDNDALIATGFHRAGPIHLVGGNADKDMLRDEVLTDMTASIGATYLGLTVGCARCHNHKFDPILQADYYRIRATLAATEFKDREIASAAEKTAHEAAKKAYDEKLKPIQKEIAEIEKPYRDRLTEAKRAKLDPEVREALAVAKEKRTPTQAELAKAGQSQIGLSWDEVVEALSAADKERRAGLRRRIHAIELTAPEQPASAYAVANMAEAPKTHILKVGDYKRKLDEVKPGFLTVMGAGLVTESPAGRRTALAEWIGSKANPLTARVMVNRIWHFRMGAGIVPTPNDFGLLGGKPTHPKLLDWLAAEFMDRNWSVKAIDRLILLSSAYRQSADIDGARNKIDSANKYYWRMNRRRQDAEVLRDNILAVTGLLNPRMGGSPVKIPLEPEIYDLIFTEGEPDNLWPLSPDKTAQYRRSIYLLNKRTVRLPMMANFDQPDAMSSCPIRPASTHALQALNLMNSDFMQEQAAAFAARLTAECGKDGLDCRVRRAYKLTLARGPKPAEMAMARSFLAKSPLDDFCLALLNRNEFVYVP